MDKQTLIKEWLSEITSGNLLEIRVSSEVGKILTSPATQRAKLYFRGVPIVIDSSLQVPWKVIQK